MLQKPKKASLRIAWQLALPMILSNITIPLLGIADIATVGHLDNVNYVSAVALGTMMIDFVYWAFGFLRMGTTGVVAQAYGRRDSTAMRSLLAQALIIAAVIAMIIMLLHRPLGDIGLWLLAPKTQSLAQLTLIYFTTRIYSAPAILANYALMGWFIGMQDTRIPLALMIIINVCNVCLDIYFVYGLGYNVAGVALASVISQYLGLLLGLYFANKLLSKHPGNWVNSEIFNWRKFKHLLFINNNIFIRTVCLLFTFAFMTAQSTRLGSVVLAANTILQNLQALMAFALDGFANAAEAMVGRAVGRGNKRLFTEAVLANTWWSIGIAVFFTLLYALTGHWQIQLMTSIDTILTTAYHYQVWLIILPLISVWSFLFDGIFIGATWAREMRNTMLFATFIIYLPTWYLTQTLGNHGLWLAFTAFMAARGLSQLYLYRSPVRHRLTWEATKNKLI